MSGKVVGWAFEAGRDLTATQRYVLVAYADNADHNGKCWPDRPEIVDKTGLSRASVYRSVTALKRAELMAEGEDEKGRWRIQLKVPWVSHSETDAVSHRDSESHSETPYIEEPSENHPPSEVGDQRSPTSSGEKSGEQTTRLCRFMTSAAGGDPDAKRYGDRQLADARYLLDHKDRGTLKAVVEWAHTAGDYWAPKVVTTTKLRRWWDELLAAYRATRRAAPPLALSESATADELPDVPGVDPGVVASAVFTLSKRGQPVTEETIKAHLRERGWLPEAA